MTVNERIALRITAVVGSMGCAYAFAVLALVSLPDALKSGSPIVIVAWIAQTFLQLVLLPIIMVGQRLQATATTRLSKQVAQHHDLLSRQHALTLKLHQHLTGGSGA